MRRFFAILLFAAAIIPHQLYAGEFRFNQVNLRVFCSDDWEVSKSPNQTDFSNPQKKLNITVKVLSAESITAKEQKAKELLRSQYDSFEISVNYSRTINGLTGYNIEGKAMKNGELDYFHICFIDNNQQTLIIVGSFPQNLLKTNKDSMRDFLNSIQIF